MYLLVEYQEGYANTSGPVYTWSLGDDYYNPVVICNTKAQLVEWLRNNRVNSKFDVNGDTITIERLNWQGDFKGVDTYRMIHVEIGKEIVY